MKAEFPMSDVRSLTIVDGVLTLRLRSAPQDGDEDPRERLRRDLRTLMELHEITAERRGSRVLLTPSSWTQDIIAARLDTRQPVVSELLNELVGGDRD